MLKTFFYITALLYLASTLAYIAYLVSRRDALLNAGKYVAIAGFVAHTLTILVRWAEGGRFPATNLHEVMSFFAWLSVGIFMVFLYRYGMAVLGLFVAPFALFLVVTASFLPGEIVPLSPLFKSWWLPVHVTLAILGNAFFALASAFGAMYLIQERHLKNRKFNGLYFILPSLDVLDELNYRCLTYGFPLLTLGIITGAIWSEYTFGTYWMWKHRQVGSLVTWLLYAALLHGRLTTDWRGRKAARYSVIAFCVLLAFSLIIYVLLGEGHGLLKLGGANP